jgi:hypothetical protein
MRSVGHPGTQGGTIPRERRMARHNTSKCGIELWEQVDDHYFPNPKMLFSETCDSTTQRGTIIKTHKPQNPASHIDRPSEAIRPCPAFALSIKHKERQVTVGQLLVERTHCSQGNGSIAEDSGKNQCCYYHGIAKNKHPRALEVLQRRSCREAKLCSTQPRHPTQSGEQSETPRTRNVAPRTTTIHPQPNCAPRSGYRLDPTIVVHTPSS